MKTGGHENPRSLLLPPRHRKNLSSLFNSMGKNGFHTIQDWYVPKLLNIHHSTNMFHLIRQEIHQIPKIPA